MLFLSVPNGGVKVARASTDAFVCAWIGRRHDELRCVMVLKKPGLFGHHKLLRVRIRHAVDDKRRRRPLRKIGRGLPEQNDIGVFERRIKSRRCQPVGSRAGNLGLQCPRPVTPGLGITMRVRIQGFSRRISSARWKKIARSCSTCARRGWGL